VNPNDPNLPMLEAVVRALGALENRFVFVGGCTTGLLVTDPAAAPVRATKDVDVIVEVMTLLDYHALERELEAAGFQRDRTPEAPICRWVVAGCLVDVMPTDEGILGFGNRWFAEAIQSAVAVRLPVGNEIRLVTPSMFLATKLEAFKARGNGDFSASHDLEDIITVVDGRPSLAADVATAGAAVRAYIASEIGNLLLSEPFLDSLYGHVPGDDASQARVPLIRERLQQLSSRADT
jgi:predicted nucleotidyltransferase